MVSFAPVKLRFTCYLLAKGHESPEAALRKSYRPGGRQALQELSPTPSVPPGCRAFLGTHEGKPPRWANELGHYFEGLAGVQPTSQKFVLFLPVADRVFAVCFGYGASALEWSAIEGNFGLRVAARALDSGALRSVQSRRIAASARSQNVSLPLGGDLRDLEVDFEGEFVRRLSGNLDASSQLLSEPGALVTSDAVAFDEVADLGTLQETLGRLYGTLAWQGSSDFAFIDALTPIPSSSDVAKELNKKLASAILDKSDLDGQDQVHLLKLIPPDEFDMDSIGEVLFEAHDEQVRFNWNDRPSLGEIVRQLHVTRGASFLKYIRVTAFASDGSPRGTVQPLLNWIVFEAGNAVQRFILSFGKWFRLSEDFTSKLNGDLLKIRDVTEELRLPEMTATEREGEYNARVARARTDFALLDMVDIRPDAGTEVEACDLFGTGGHLIHVKKWDGSHDMSHHLSQGTVSVALLVEDPVYRAAFQTAVSSVNVDLSDAAGRAPEIVTWAVAISPRYDFPLGLPSFSKINLRDAAKRVRSSRAEPTLARIDRQ